MQIESLNDELKNKDSIIESRGNTISELRNDYNEKVAEVNELEKKIRNFYNTSESIVQQQPYQNPVYITYSGSKYHKYGCFHLKKSCIKIELSTAKSKGYTPCKNCL